MISQFEKVKAKKEDTRGMRSAVHSKDYMQSLLIDTLRKAGYEKKIPSSVNRTIEVEKVSNRRQKKRGNKSMLEDNPFDQYYFGKI